MVRLFHIMYTTSVDLVHYYIVHAQLGKAGITIVW